MAPFAYDSSQRDVYAISTMCDDMYREYTQQPLFGVTFAIEVLTQARPDRHSGAWSLDLFLPAIDVIKDIADRWDASESVEA